MTDGAVATPSRPIGLSGPRLVGRRLVAACVDLLLLPSLLARLGDIAAGVPGEWVGRAVGLAAAVVLQGVAGLSVGMAVVGLVVTRDDGAAPLGVRASALRHAWILAPLLATLPAAAYGMTSSDAVLVAVTVAGGLLGLVGVALPPLLLGTMIADDDGRGLHDRWAQATVAPAATPDNRAATIGILVLLWATLTVASWWLGAPDTVSSDRLGSGSVEEATCEVDHDPLVGERREEAVQLTRGMDRVELRLGAHVVRFDDEPFASMRQPSFMDVEEVGAGDGPAGLFYEVGSGTFGSTSFGTGSGSDGGFHLEIEVDGGLAGGLRMDCRGEDGAFATVPETPVVTPSDG